MDGKQGKEAKEARKRSSTKANQKSKKEEEEYKYLAFDTQRYWRKNIRVAIYKYDYKNKKRFWYNILPMPPAMEIGWVKDEYYGPVSGIPITYGQFLIYCLNPNALDHLFFEK